MCKFCVGMLTGVLVCIACLGVGLKLLHSGVINLSPAASASTDDPEPIPSLDDPVPVFSEPAPAPPQPIGRVPHTTLPAPVGVVAPEELISPPLPETTEALAQSPVPPTPPEPLMPRASDDPQQTPLPVLAQPVSTSGTLPATLAVRTEPVARPQTLFLGTHRLNLDDERRLKLPASFREQCGDLKTLCLTPGNHRQLVVSSEAAALALLEQKMQQPSGDAEAIRRIHFANTEVVKIDVEGNCVIPEMLTTLAGLTREVVFIGVGTHVEIWDAQTWQKYLEQELASSPRAASGYTRPSACPQR